MPEGTSIQVEVIGADRLLMQLRAAPEETRKAAREAMGLSVLEVEREVKARTPRKTGRLFSSIHSQVIGAGSTIGGRVGTSVSYAPFVELGTKPHDIVPVRAQALMLPVAPTGGFGGGRLSGKPRSGQQVAFYKKVHHPGTKAIHYMRDGARAAMPKVEAIFYLAAKKVAEFVAHG